MPLQDREDMTNIPDRQGQIPPIQGPSGDLVKAVSFDAAGTLIHLAEPVGVSYSRIAEPYGFQVAPDALDRAFREVWKTILPAFSPACPITSIEGKTERDWWRSTVRSVFEEAGVSETGEERFDGYFTELYDHFARPGTWLAADGALEVLQSLSDRVSCVVLSNFDERLRPILADLKMADHFDEIILSSEIRASKPDPKMFSAAKSSLKTDPAHILHIGDDPVADWEGATAAGFQIFRVGKGQNTLRDLFPQLSLAE